MDAAFEREKDSDRRARDAAEERVKALAKLESHAAEHERELARVRAEFDKKTSNAEDEIKRLREKAEALTTAAASAEGRLGAVDEEHERLRRELDRRAGDIKRHESEIDRRRGEVTAAENETRRANDAAAKFQSETAAIAARLDASERDRESAVSAVSAAKEEAAAAIAAAHAETRDARAEALALASAASSKTEEIAPLLTKIERLTVELSHAENLADTRRDELNSECEAPRARGGARARAGRVPDGAAVHASFTEGDQGKRPDRIGGWVGVHTRRAVTRAGANRRRREPRG